MNTVFVMKNEGISKSFNKEYVEFLNYFVHSIENGNILNFRGFKILHVELTIPLCYMFIR